MALEDKQKVFGFYLPSGADAELFKQSVLAYITAIFLGLIFLIFIFPKFSDLTVISNEVSNLRKKVNTMNKTLDALDSFKANVPESSINTVFKAIPLSFDPGYILLSLRKLAQDNKVSLTNYSLSGGKTIEEDKKVVKNNIGVARHLIKLEISGSPLNLISFVENLDKYLPVASVSNLSISEVSKILFKTTADSKLSMELTYYHLPVSIDGKSSIEGKYLDLKDLDMIRTISSYSKLEDSFVSTQSSEIKQNLFGLE